MPTRDVLILGGFGLFVAAVLLFRRRRRVATVEESIKAEARAEIQRNIAETTRIARETIIRGGVAPPSVQEPPGVPAGPPQEAYTPEWFAGKWLDPILWGTPEKAPITEAQPFEITLTKTPVIGLMYKIFEKAVGLPATKDRMWKVTSINKDAMAVGVYSKELDMTYSVNMKDFQIYAESKSVLF